MFLQNLANIELQLTQLQNEECEAREIEQKSAQDRRKAIEDLEKGVSHIRIRIRVVVLLSCFI